MNRIVAKVIVMIASFIIPFIFTILPWKISPWMISFGGVGFRILSCILCFGGGIFLGTYLIHLTPESRHLLEENLLVPNGIEYPVVDLMIGLGFFFVLLLDHSVVMLKGRKMRTERCATANPASEAGHSSAADLVDKADGEMESAACNCENRCEELAPDLDKISEISISISSSSINPPKHHSHFNNDNQVRSIVMVIALSMHHFFEGMILGLQDSVQALFIITLALICHESIIQFSLGLQLVKSGIRFRAYMVTSVAVCLIMPLGVGVGTLLVELGSDQTTVDIVSGFLQSFASGTFLYVIFFEIFVDELTPEATNMWKIASSFLGFATMALLKLVPEAHAHDCRTPNCTDSLAANMTYAVVHELVQ